MAGRSFDRAEDFLRIGDKAEALRLMYRNFDGLRSPRSLARMLLRLLIPYPLMRWRRRHLQRRATARYGSIRPRCCSLFTHQRTLADDVPIGGNLNVQTK